MMTDQLVPHRSQALARSAGRRLGRDLDSLTVIYETSAQAIHTYVQLHGQAEYAVAVTLAAEERIYREQGPETLTDIDQAAREKRQALFQQCVTHFLLSAGAQMETALARVANEAPR